MTEAVFTAFATLGISDSLHPSHSNRFPSIYAGMVAKISSGRSKPAEHPVSVWPRFSVSYGLAVDMQSSSCRSRGISDADFIFSLSQCEFWFRWPVATHLLSVVQHPKLMHAFTKKDQLKDVMERIPVHLITGRRSVDRSRQL
jgi:hypothetical protein